MSLVELNCLKDNLMFLKEKINASDSVIFSRIFQKK